MSLCLFGSEHICGHLLSDCYVAGPGLSILPVSSLIYPPL